MVGLEAAAEGLWWWWLLLLWCAPPFLSCAPAPLSGEHNPLTPLLCPFIAAVHSEFLSTRCAGEDRRLRYPFVLLMTGEDSLLWSDLTTRRSIRTVVLWTWWAGPAVVVSLAWTFIHRRRFRFPHCKTKSDDVVAVVVTCDRVSGWLWWAVVVVLNNNPLVLLLLFFSIIFYFCMQHAAETFRLCCTKSPPLNPRKLILLKNNKQRLSET